MKYSKYRVNYLILTIPDNMYHNYMQKWKMRFNQGLQYLNVQTTDVRMALTNL